MGNLIPLISCEGFYPQFWALSVESFTPYSAESMFSCMSLRIIPDEHILKPCCTSKKIGCWVGYWPIFMLQLKTPVFCSAIYAAYIVQIFAGTSPTRQDFFAFIDDIFFHICAFKNCGNSSHENGGILM